MTLYQRKSTPFTAIQWTCNNYEEVKTFTNGNVALSADNSCVIVNGLTVCDNDWILAFSGRENSNGPIITKYSTCSDVIFQEEYELYQGLQ